MYLFMFLGFSSFMLASMLHFFLFLYDSLNKDNNKIGILRSTCHWSVYVGDEAISIVKKIF